MQKWEYLSVALLTPDRPIQGTLDKYGEESWELVTVVPLHPEQEVEVEIEDGSYTLLITPLSLSVPSPSLFHNPGRR